MRQPWVNLGGDVWGGVVYGGSGARRFALWLRRLFAFFFAALPPLNEAVRSDRAPLA